MSSAQTEYQLKRIADALEEQNKLRKEAATNWEKDRQDAMGLLGGFDSTKDQLGTVRNIDGGSDANL